MDDKQLALFDYGTLDLDTRFFVQTKTAEIRILVKQTAQGIIEIGQRLIEVKERLPHCEFLPWVNAEFGWSERTAQDWMNVTKTFKTATGADLSMFQSKALYLLSAPSTPEPAREEALSLAGLGEDMESIKRICRDNPAAMDAIDRVTVGKVGAPEGNQNAKIDKTNILNTNNCNNTSTDDKSYALRRLRKDRPDLHQQVLQGKLSAHAG